MSSLEITNLGGLVTGRLGEAPLDIASLRCEDGKLASFDAPGHADVVVDACGSVAVPGLIDSHAHVAGPEFERGLPSLAGELGAYHLLDRPGEPDLPAVRDLQRIN